MYYQNFHTILTMLSECSPVSLMPYNQEQDEITVILNIVYLKKKLVISKDVKSTYIIAEKLIYSQENVEALQEWTKDCFMEFHTIKCRVRHITNKRCRKILAHTCIVFWQVESKKIFGSKNLPQTELEFPHRQSGRKNDIKGLLAEKHLPVPTQEKKTYDI